MQKPHNPYATPQTSTTSDTETFQGTMPQKHSGFGIASFVISIIAGLTFVFFALVAGVLTTLAQKHQLNANSMASMLTGLMIILSLLVQLVAIGLGIGGLCQKNRKKIFAVLGLAFSASLILFMFGLAIIGAVMQ